ncbi:MAG: hypothetical protein PUP91_14965 [Rhizonema sp. PD37]|nr:hypothetical protein [Rhizonema sp. PD37]
MKGKYLTLIGTALTLALTSNVAVAQSTKFRVLEQTQSASPSNDQTLSQATQVPGSPGQTPERKLRPDVLKILCADFPLNSRCQDTSATKPGGSTSTDVKPSDAPPEKKPRNRKKPRTQDNTPTTPGSAPSDVGTPGSQTGGPPDNTNPPSSPPGTGTPNNLSPSGTPGSSDSPPGGLPPTAPSAPNNSSGGSNQITPNTGVPSTPTTPGSAPSDTGTPGSQTGAPPDSTNPQSTPPGTGTPSTNP